jgi:aryl-alcohol dehydrogenase-like predicted oxidoreductase
MRYAQLGRSGLIMSRLAFGAGSLGVGKTLPGARKVPGTKQADWLVACAIDASITLFATSAVTSGIFDISREDQLDDNPQAASVTLSGEAVARLDATTAAPARFPGWMLRLIPDPRTRALLGGA